MEFRCAAKAASGGIGVRATRFTVSKVPGKPRRGWQMGNMEADGQQGLSSGMADMGFDKGCD